MLLEINPDNPQLRLIQQVVEKLKNGAVICYPTDTGYGIGCDIFDPKAIKRIQQITGRPARQALLLHVFRSQTYQRIRPCLEYRLPTAEKMPARPLHLCPARDQAGAQDHAHQTEDRRHQGARSSHLPDCSSRPSAIRCSTPAYRQTTTDRPQRTLSRSMISSATGST